VFVEEVYYGPPACYPPPNFYHDHCHPRVGWSVGFSSH
jgi:hypothetical protein